MKESAVLFLMKLLILSDSHSDVVSLKKILKREKNVDAVIHLGDGGTDMWDMNEYTQDLPCYQCQGNCDSSFYNFSAEINLTLCSKKIMACHGHRYNVKSGINTIYFAAKEKEADICLYGHTHMPNNEYYAGVHLFNPGAVKDGRYGIIEIDEEKILPTLKNIY